MTWKLSLYWPILRGIRRWLTISHHKKWCTKDLVGGSTQIKGEPGHLGHEEAQKMGSNVGVRVRHITSFYFAYLCGESVFGISYQPWRRRFGINEKDPEQIHVDNDLNVRSQGTIFSLDFSKK